MNSVSENYENEKNIIASILHFCREFSVGSLLKQANAYKSKGIPVIQVFIYLLNLVYTKKSMYMNIENGTHNAGFAKDVVYRLLNCTYINWSKFILSIALRVTQKITHLTSDERLNALVIDDTFYGRERSEKVELLANVHDHASKGKKFKRGFRQLTLAWTDGCTTIPVIFRHLSSEKKKNRYNVNFQIKIGVQTFAFSN